MGIFAIFFIPEMKDRTLEEIDEMFMVGLPAWKFKGISLPSPLYWLLDYVCTGIGKHREVNDSAPGQGTPEVNDEKSATSNEIATPAETAEAWFSCLSFL